MTTTEPARHQSAPEASGDRAGYLAAVVVNAALLFVVNNLLSWGVLPFLTDDFARVLPILNLSLIASIVVNVVYLSYDERWFTSLTQVGVLAISMATTVRIYRVFPFDFVRSDFPWSAVTRAMLIAAMVGVAIAIVVEVIKLGTAGVRS